MNNPNETKSLTARILYYGFVIASIVTLALLVLYWRSILLQFQSGWHALKEANAVSDGFETLISTSFKVKHKIFQLIGCTVLAFGLYMSSRFVEKLRSGKKFWVESVISSFFLIACTTLLAHFTMIYATSNDMDLIINNEEDIKMLMKSEEESYVKHKATAPPNFVPTGIFIQSIEFTNSYNCLITGYVWQRYRKADSLIAKGFLFPEAQEIEVEEVYRRDYNDSIETLGWHFKATIREIFEFQHYPFDYQNLWIRIWHKDFDKNVVLIPDLGSYPEYNPVKMPGIEEHIVLSGWKLKGAYFGYNYNNYNTNFGVPTYVDRFHLPELHYNLFIQRDFMGIFFSDLVPVLMVVVLVFITLMLTTKHGTYTGFFEFNVMEVIGMVATLLFVVILAHTELRSEFSTDTIFYMEYYYFMLYLSLFGVLMNYILFNSTSLHIFIIDYKNNYIPKVLFLPIFALCIFLITFGVFYH